MATVGTILTTIIPLLEKAKIGLSALGGAGKTAGATVGAGGVAASAGWAPLLIITAVLIASFAILALYLDHVKKNSPEGKLAAAADETNRAAEAANAAAEAYNNLNASLDNLSDKYEAMDTMVRGTQEWREALFATNEEVLDLIAKYPKLAAAFKNVEGVLTITNQELIDSVLKEAEDQKVYTQMAELGAQLHQSEA